MRMNDCAPIQEDSENQLPKELKIAQNKCGSQKITEAKKSGTTFAKVVDEDALIHT